MKHVALAIAVLAMACAPAESDPPTPPPEGGGQGGAGETRPAPGDRPQLIRPTPPPAGSPYVDIMWRATDIAGAVPAPRMIFTMMLDSGGRIGGKSGCNGYGARYLLDGDKLRVFPPMIGTMMACVPEVMEQEQAFQSIVTEAERIEKTDAGIAVVAKDGRRIAFVATAEGTRPGPVGPAPLATIMRCGEQQFRVRFLPDRAIVQVDGSDETIELPLLATPNVQSSQRTYTNGRMTFIEDSSGPKSVRFARGKMAFVQCNIAQH